jgi:carboxypeptidase C (cathepsin A)
MSNQQESRTSDDGNKAAIPAPEDVLIESKHTITIADQRIPYTVTCGTMVLKKEEQKKGEDEGVSEGEKAKATIFFIAYQRDEVKDKSQRPITFSFNGGPGSSSVWLHLGLLGPKRVVMDADGFPLPPPYKLTENQFSLLSETDLVFIDPISTGYSRILPGEKAKPFLGFKGDIESVGDFIRLFCTRYQRWSSPKFLIGESYGTTRAAGLAGYLQERHGMYLNGLMLISSILNFQTHHFEVGNDLPYLVFLPTYCAAAWYHQCLSQDLQQKDLQDVLREVEAFSSAEYAKALFKGDSLSQDEYQQIVQKLARYTGLSESYLQNTNLRIEIFRFTKELLRQKQRTIGRLDTRYVGIDRDAAGENFEHDPSMSAIMGTYTGTFYDYVRSELKFESDLPYEILNFKVFPEWSYAEHENRFVDVSETLRKAIAVNPYLKVHIACGYYDLATPYFASEYTFNHLSLDPSLRDNLSMSYYEAGHMMYVQLASLEKLNQKLSDFIHAAS